jgi:hypothetical protein
MNWVDRYVAAVERSLPAAGREDVGEEIRSLLEEKLSDAEEAKGQPLTEAETLERIQELGHPLQVASRYGDQRALVSAALFPLYQRAVKLLFLGVVVLLILAGVVSASGVGWWPDDMGHHVQLVGWWSLGLLTAGFYFADGALRRSVFDRWDPRRLPAVERGAPIPLFESLAALVFCALWFALLSGLSAEWSWAAATGRSETPWSTTILYAKLHVVLVMILNAVALFRPWWSRAKLVFKALTDLLLSGVALWALLNEGAWWPLQSILLAFVVAGLLGVAGSFRAFARFGHTPSPPTSWLDRQVRTSLEKSLPQDSSRQVGEDVARSVSEDLGR